MKITYLNCDAHRKLFSWYNHDYQTFEKDDKHYMIDGGISVGELYGRYSADGIVEQSDIKDIIKDIRNSFLWGQNYNEKNERLEETKYALLKELTSSHICGIISYMNNKIHTKLVRNEIKDDNLDVTYPVINKQECIILEIFAQELDYRIKNKLI